MRLLEVGAAKLGFAATRSRGFREICRKAATSASGPSIGPYRVGSAASVCSPTRQRSTVLVSAFALSTQGRHRWFFLAAGANSVQVEMAGVIVAGLARDEQHSGRSSVRLCRSLRFRQCGLTLC